MVPPTYNRVRGKDKDQRTRDKRHRDKMNAKQAGKIAPLLVKDRGKGAAGVGKKKMKVGEPCSNYASPACCPLRADRAVSIPRVEQKKEQKARLLKQAATGTSSAKMEY
jgi:hypothetical protein